MAISILKTPMQRAEERLFDESVPVTAAEEVTAVGLRVMERLRQRMARECEAMAQHALSTGYTVPFEVVERLDQALSPRDAPAAAITPGRRSVDDAAREDATVGSAPSAEMSSLASLSVAHGALAHIIAPATPEAVLLLADQRATHPLLYALGPLPIVRQILGLAVLSLFLLLAVALSDDVNAVNMSKTMLTLSGYPLFVKEAFLVSAASLGSCFQNLQKINVVISDGTYDPKFQSTYWTRWVMGVISGVILSQLVYVLLMPPPPTNAASVPLTIGQPILALLGGYSVDLVHGILSHTIDTLSGFIRGSRDRAVENQVPARGTGSDVGEVDRGLRSGRPAA
jgi:hypothetical protein